MGPWGRVGTHQTRGWWCRSGWARWCWVARHRRVAWVFARPASDEGNDAGGGGRIFLAGGGHVIAPQAGWGWGAGAHCSTALADTAAG